MNLDDCSVPTAASSLQEIYARGSMASTLPQSHTSAPTVHVTPTGHYINASWSTAPGQIITGQNITRNVTVVTNNGHTTVNGIPARVSDASSSRFEGV